jgi:hypothetical protein
VPWKLSSENFEWGIWFKKISLKELSKHIAQSFVIFRRKEEKKRFLVYLYCINTDLDKSKGQHGNTKNTMKLLNKGH